MIIPENMTESTVLEIIDKICEKISYKFVFGFYTRDDIKQQAWIFAIEGLEKYKPEFPLENFLWVHVKNRLCNFKRNNYTRLDKPCLKCPLKAYIKDRDLCTAYSRKQDCSFYSRWESNNLTKQNIVKPINIGVVAEHQESCMSMQNSFIDQLGCKEIIDIIEENLSVEYRPYWLHLKAGIKLYKEDQNKLHDEIVKILQENNVDVSQAW